MPTGFNALTHEIVRTLIQCRLSPGCVCDLNPELRTGAPNGRNHLLRRQPPGEVQDWRSLFENHRKRHRLERQDVVHCENPLGACAHRCHRLTGVVRSKPSEAAKDAHPTGTGDGDDKVRTSAAMWRLKNRRYFRPKSAVNAMARGVGICP